MKNIKPLFLVSLCYRVMIAMISATLLVSCGDSEPQSPESKVRQTLAAIEKAAEKRSLSDFMQHISESYKDHQGNTKENIRRLVQFQYLRNQNIHIFTTVQSLNVNDSLASVELNAAMAASEAELDTQKGGLRADTRQFSIVLRLQDDQETWLVDSVSWERGWGSY